MMLYDWKFHKKVLIRYRLALVVLAIVLGSAYAFRDAWHLEYEWFVIPVLVLLVGAYFVCYMIEYEDGSN